MPSNTLEAAPLFDTNYTLLFSALPGEVEKIEIGDRSHRVCRFCGKDESETTFKNVAHSIPESIGNKRIITNNECDNCNTFFSNNVEIHFDKIAKVYRQIGQIRGKKGIPSYKTKSKKSRIDFDNGIIVKESIDDPIIEFSENKTATFVYEIEPYIPIGIYKSFIKMAISIMPEEELGNFQDTIRWILNPDHSQPFIQPAVTIETFIPGPRPINGLVAFLLKKTSKAQMPPYIFVLGFGNIMYQICIPSSLDTDKATVQYEIPIFPTPYENGYKYGKPKVIQRDYTAHTIVKGEKFPVTHQYDSKIPVKK